MRPRFLYTDFRRIYGVVFRILLCGEAKFYLRKLFVNIYRFYIVIFFMARRYTSHNDNK